MKKIRISLLSVLGLTMLLVCISCKNPFLSKDSATPETTTTTPTPAPTPSVTITTVIGEVSKSLSSKNIYSEAELAAIAKGATDSVGSANVASVDLTAYVPVATGGAVASLENLVFSTWDDAKRTTCVKSIVAGYVTALNNRVSEPSAAKNIFSRNLSSYQSTVNTSSAISAILARISKAAVENLARTGISPANRGEAAGGVVNTMITSLATGGVNKTIVNDALGKITKAAVESLKAGGLTEQAAQQTAVSSITKGAITAMSGIAMDGVSASDYPAMASEIARSAVKGSASLATNSADATAFSASVASGASDGIIAVKKASTAMTGGELSALIQGTMTGTTTGALDTGGTTSGADAKALIAKITSTVSEKLTNASTGLDATIDQKAILSEITKGTAAAVTVASASGGYTSSDLLGAIALTGNDGKAVIVDQTDVTAGVSLGTNTAPVADAGADTTVTTGTLVNLSAAKSTDKEDDAAKTKLTYLWSFVSKPATAEGLFTGSFATVSSVTASFTPNIAGTYRVSVKVTDSKGVCTEAFCKITVTASAVDANYEGKTAAQRLDAAQALRDSGDKTGARDQLLILLDKYPVSDVTPNAIVRLGDVYNDLGQRDLASARYTETYTNYPNAPAAQDAKISLGWLILGNRKDATDIDRAAALFKAVNDLNLKTATGANSIHGLGDIAVVKGQNIDARTLELQARDSEYADVWCRYYSQRSYAQTFFNEGNIAEAIKQMNLLKTDNKYTYKTKEDESDPSKQLKNLLFDTDMTMSDGYNSLGGTYINDRITLLESVLTNAKYEQWMRLRGAQLLGEYYLWNAGNVQADFIKARDYLKNALAANTGTDISTRQQRTLVSLRLGQAYDRLLDTASSTERSDIITAAIAAYDAAAAELSNEWGHSAAAEALVNKASVLLWQKQDRTGAETILVKLISEYPSNCDRYPLAYATNRLGSVYQSMGYDARDKYGKDYEQYFRQAITNFAKCIPGNFPELKATDWYFQEAAQNMAQCYLELGERDKARSLYADQLANTGTDLNRKANIQYMIGRCWEADAFASAGNGEFDKALTLAGTATTEFEKVLTNFKNKDGSFVDNGSEASDALIELAWMYNRIGDYMDHYNYRDKNDSTVVATYQKAIDAYARITDEAFPTLSKTRWCFFARYRDASNAYLNIRDWDGARACLDKLLKPSFPADLFGADRELDVLRAYAYTYRREAELNSSWTNGSRDVTGCAIILDRMPKAIARYKDVIARDKKIDNGANAGWSLVDLCWSYNKLMDGGLYTEDKTTTLSGYVQDLDTLLNAPGAFCMADGTTLYNEGQTKADGMRAYASVLRNYANNVRNWAPSTDTNRSKNYEATLKKAVTYYTAAMAVKSANSDTVMDSRSSIAETYWDLASNDLYGGSGTSVADYFNASRDMAEALIADPEAEARYVARAARVLGWINVRFGHVLVGKVADIKTDQDWKDTAVYWFNFILSNKNYREANGTWTATDCQSGLNSEELKIDYADPGMDFVSILKADGAWHMCSSPKTRTSMYFNVTAAGTYTLAWSDLTDGKFPGATDVKLTLKSSDGTLVIDAADSGYTTPKELNLQAGTYFIIIDTADTTGVSCRLKLAKK